MNLKCSKHDISVLRRDKPRINAIGGSPFPDLFPLICNSDVFRLTRASVRYLLAFDRLLCCCRRVSNDC